MNIEKKTITVQQSVGVERIVLTLEPHEARLILALTGKCVGTDNRASAGSVSRDLYYALSALLGAAPVEIFAEGTPPIVFVPNSAKMLKREV